jgi:hypothetical protein
VLHLAHFIFICYLLPSYQARAIIISKLSLSSIWLILKLFPKAWNMNPWISTSQRIFFFQNMELGF